MNRLTFKKVFRYYNSNKETQTTCITKHVQITENENPLKTEYFLVGDVVDRLAAYEDTGLEPNEICEMIDDHTFLIESTCNEKEKLGEFARRLRQHKVEINGVIAVSDTLFEMICRVIEGTEEL